METLDSNISESNKIPGSGCDTFTRPEEIQALSKYLGYIRKIQDENTRLDNELLGIPGKTTGKFPEIDKLPNEAAELDLSRENQIKSLSDKLVSLDKSSSLNKIENIEHLPDTKVTLTGDEKSESLSNKIIPLGNTDDIERLEDKRENLEVGENINNLETERLNLDITEDIELSNTRENLDVTEDIKLGNTKENLDITDDIELSNTKETLDITEDIELSNIKENLDITENIELSNIKETLDITDDIELGNTKETLDITEDIELSNIKETLDITEYIELSNTIENLDITEDIELSNTKETLDVIENIELSNIKETLDITENIELSNFIDNLLGDLEDISELDDERILLNNTDHNIQLGDQILTLDDISLIDNLPEESLNLGGSIPNINLQTEKENLDNINEISELGSLKINLDTSDKETTLSDFLDELSDSKAPELDKDYDYFNPSNPGAQLYDATIGLEVEEDEKELSNSIVSRPEDWGEGLKNPLVGKYNLTGDAVGEIPRTESDYDYFNPREDKLNESTLDLPSIKSPELGKGYDYFNPEEDKLNESTLDLPVDWVKTEYVGGIYNSEVDGKSSPDGDFEVRRFLLEKGLKNPLVGKYNLTGDAEGDIPRVDSDYDLFQNISVKGLNEEELYDRIIRFGDDYTKQTSINNSGNVIPDSYNEGVWYDVDAKINEKGEINGVGEDGKVERSENPAMSWYSKIKSLVSAYLSSNNSSIPEHKIKQFEEKLYGAVKIFQESIKLSGGEIDLPKYKLGDFNNISPSTYLRWLAEESIGNITSGKAREVLLKEALGLLVWGRDELEKLAKSEKYRLPGNSGIIGDLVSGGLDVEASIRSASNVVSSAISNENINPVNRPNKDKETTGWINSNRRLSLSKEVSDKVEGNSNKKGSLLGTIKDVGNILSGNPGDNNYNFWSNYLQGQGIATTLMDLAGSDVNNMKNGSVEDLYKLLRNSPYITSADKMVTTMSWGEKYNVQTLDSNSHWEIVFEPYAGNLNGNYTFLPLINEINKRNLAVHGVTTRYDKWIPFSSFDLQKEKLVSKSLGLYDGEISYPTGIEFTNELRLTIVDDQFKSWRTYFETCMYASVYSSTPNVRTESSSYKKLDLEKYVNRTGGKYIPPENYTKEIEEALGQSIEDFYIYGRVPEFNNGSEEVITIDRNYQLIAPYKNLAFRCRIYVMTPQKSTITKFDLLLVLKDFVSEYSGEIDSSGTDLTLSFSIVGENPLDETDSGLGDVIQKEIEERDKESQKKKKTNVWSNLADHTGNTAIKLL